MGNILVYLSNCSIQKELKNLFLTERKGSVEFSSRLQTSISSIDSSTDPQTRLVFLTKLSAISSRCFGLISVWVNMWVFKWLLLLNIFLQTGQWWSLSDLKIILWTDNPLAWLNPFPHCPHSKGLCFVCVYLWSLRWSCLLKAFPQTSQGNGLSSVWVLSWIRRL